MFRLWLVRQGVRISEVHQIYLERMGTGHRVESKVFLGGGGRSEMYLVIH